MEIPACHQCVRARECETSKTFPFGISRNAKPKPLSFGGQIIHFFNSTSYNNIGLVHENKGEYDKALEYQQKTLAIRLKKLGPDHPSVANSYHNIAFLYKDKKDLPKAKEYWEKAYAIYLKKLGSNHPYTKGTKGQLDALKE